MMEKQRLVIIGNGMSGARLIEEVLAHQGKDIYDIVVFGDEPYGNYNRILLSNVLAGEHDPADIFINPLNWYQEQGVTLYAGNRVQSIDPVRKLVHATDGIEVPYDKLVIATGSKPYIPNLQNLYAEQGNLKTGVFVFRSFDDCDAMIAYAQRSQRVVVIGGGVLGLEAARGLQNRGLEAHVVHVSKHLMNVQLDMSAGRMLRLTLERMGVKLHFQKRSNALLGTECVTGVAFEDGSQLDCDMVVISTGILPNVDLAKNAGIAVDRGILVQDDLSCSLPDVYAVGECTQHRGRTYGLVAPLWEQAQCLAEHLTLQSTPRFYQGSRELTKLKIMGIDLAVMGDKEEVEDDDEVVVYSEPSRGIYKKLIVRENRLAGAILLGDGTVTPRVLQLFDRHEELPENRSELLFSLSHEQQGLNIADLPDDTQICNCNGVSKGMIVEAVKSGKRSLKVLCDATRAGSGCGTCMKDVQAILEFASDGAVIEDPSVHYYVPGVPLAKPELIKAIKEQHLYSVSAVFNVLAAGKEDAGSKAGLASLLKTIWGKEYEDERDSRFINDRVHANIQKDGTFSVVPRIYGGVITPQELLRIANVANKYNVPMVKLTGGQRIDLVGLSREQLPAVWNDLGMPSGHAYTKSFRTCKTCLGTEFCRYGVGDSTTLGINVEKRYQGIESPHKMKLAVSGCPRNCAESTTKDIGVVAIEGGKWEVYVGGAAGATVRKGDKLCVVDTQEAVLLYMGRFIQYYREHAKYLERTYGFVERVGIERLRQLLIDDVDGICQQLDHDIQASVDAYVDPWQEASQPVTPAQFMDVLQPVEKITAL